MNLKCSEIVSNSQNKLVESYKQHYKDVKDHYGDEIFAANKVLLEYQAKRNEFFSLRVYGKKRDNRFLQNLEGTYRFYEKTKCIFFFEEGVVELKQRWCGYDNKYTDEKKIATLSRNDILELIAQIRAYDEFIVYLYDKINEPSENEDTQHENVKSETVLETNLGTQMESTESKQEPVPDSKTELVAQTYESFYVSPANDGVLNAIHSSLKKEGKVDCNLIQFKSLFSGTQASPIQWNGTLVSLCYFIFLLKQKEIIEIDKKPNYLATTANLFLIKGKRLKVNSVRGYFNKKPFSKTVKKDIDRLLDGIKSNQIKQHK